MFVFDPGRSSSDHVFTLVANRQRFEHECRVLALLKAGFSARIIREILKRPSNAESVVYDGAATVAVPAQAVDKQTQTCASSRSYPPNSAELPSGLILLTQNASRNRLRSPPAAHGLSEAPACRPETSGDWVEENPQTCGWKVEGRDEARRNDSGESSTESWSCPRRLPPPTVSASRSAARLLPASPYSSFDVATSRTRLSDESASSPSSASAATTIQTPSPSPNPLSPRCPPVPSLEHPAGMSVECDGVYPLKHSSSFGSSFTSLPPGSPCAFNSALGVHSDSAARRAPGMSVSASRRPSMATPLVNVFIPSIESAPLPNAASKVTHGRIHLGGIPSDPRRICAPAPSISVVVIAAVDTAAASPSSLSTLLGMVFDEHVLQSGVLSLPFGSCFGALPPEPPPTSARTFTSHLQALCGTLHRKPVLWRHRTPSLFRVLPLVVAAGHAVLLWMPQDKRSYTANTIIISHRSTAVLITARLAPPHRRKYGDTKPPRMLLVPPTPRSSSPSARASLMTSPAASTRVRGQDTTPPPRASRSAGAVLFSPYPGPPPQCPPNSLPPCAPKPPLPLPYATLRAEMNEG
ncbi:hypothetical protein DFH09DRAFT_1307304 [Mycena vulgaris]|nr:hypothetical protein DFH09DRAFT_1307304 [Mycena vulgaris]